MRSHAHAGLVHELKRGVLDAYLFEDAVGRAARHGIGADLLQSGFIDRVIEIMLRDRDHAMGRFDFDKAG